MKLVSRFPDGSLTLDASLAAGDLSDSDLASMGSSADSAQAALHSGKGAGSDFLGWLNPMSIAADSLISKIEETAKALHENSDCLVVIGIGGSYLGTRAVDEALRTPGDAHQLKYAGINMSPHYISDLMKSLDGKRYAINIVSKSGTTTEPAIAFRILRMDLEKRLGHNASKHMIVATTDAQKGALKKEADSEEWTSYVIPDDVGGRFSVLTPVGLLPLAYAGVDIRALRDGAAECAKACRSGDSETNPARLYASLRRKLYQDGKYIEILASFEPRLEQFMEWWKQLTGESEGKDGAGIYPGGVIYSRDLHSVGQWVQEGRRIIFETFLSINDGEPSFKVPKMEGASSGDGLDYLAGRELGEINRVAEEATMQAHAEGGCPNMRISVRRMDPYHLGALIYFFEYAIALSGYIGGINPFNQPGVEVYKREMFRRLGKPV